jgi:hypothetical protein
MKQFKPIRKPLSRRQMFDAVADQLKPPFRGEIWQYFQDVPLGRNYSNSGMPFDIDSANYIRIPQQLIRAAPYGKFVFMCAVQTLKTLCCIEQPAGYFMANDPGDMIIYFSGDGSAKDQSKGRCTPYLKGHPEISKIFTDVIDSGPTGRYNITTDEFFLPGMVLRIWPLNESSTQRMTLRYVFISDAYLTKKTGLIKNAMARTTQHDTNRIRDYKIVLESQGGEAGDDFDGEWASTNQRILHVSCPFCASRQPFEWRHRRLKDFVPVPTLDIPSLDRQAWIEHHGKILRGEDRQWAGMQRGENVKRADDSYAEAEILSGTYYECFHCGSLWRDEPKVRLAIDRTSEYPASNPSASPDAHGFWWPGWCGQRIRWGKIMLEYLQAKKAALQGNYTDLQIWHQKREARPWSIQQTRPQIEITGTRYDPNEAIENEHSRNMYVDCQQDQDIYDRTGTSIVGWFWYIIRVVDNVGNSRQLARGFAKSWEAWIAVQDKWSVPNNRVHIDVNKWGPQIQAQAAAHVRMVKVEKPVPPFLLREKPLTWLLMAGTDEMKFTHPDRKERIWSPAIRIHERIFDKDGRMLLIPLIKVRVANIPFSIQLDAIRSGAPGMPRFEVLDRSMLDDLTKEKEVGNCVYEKQMEGQYYDPLKGKYIQVHQDDHYRDCERGLLVRQAIDGKLGHQAVSQEG